VGIDRLLNAIGAIQELPFSEPAVIIDVGTAMTVDLLDHRHVFVGGAILPGPRMMFESLHQYTAKLPLIDGYNVPGADPPGKNTRDAISAGVMAAAMGAADFLVSVYAALCPSAPWVVMTGGALGCLADYHFEGIENTISSNVLTLRGIHAAAEALP
jgi:type III pantothenate kinase